MQAPDCLLPSPSRQLRWPGSRPGTATTTAGIRGRHAATRYVPLPVKTKEEVLQEVIAQLRAQAAEDAEQYLQVLLKHKAENGLVRWKEAHAMSKLQACEVELERERGWCRQLAQDNAEFKREERFHIQFVKGFLRELIEVRRLLVKEILEQYKAYSHLVQLRELGNHHEQTQTHNKELFVLGEKTAQRLQHENDFLRNEIRTLMSNGRRVSDIVLEVDVSQLRSLSDSSGSRDQHHHEQNPAIQATFQEQMDHQREQISQLKDSERRASLALTERTKDVDKLRKQLLNEAAKSKLLLAKENDPSKVAKLELEALERDIHAQTKVLSAARRRNEMRAATGAITATYGKYTHFEMGLDRFYGKAPAGDDDYLFLAMEREFKGRQLELKTSNYGGITSNLSFEWDFVVNPDQIRDTLEKNASFNSSGVDPVTKIEYPKRKTVPLEMFLRHPTAILAKLTKAELVGLRLYTGPAYAVLNASLRETLQKHTNGQDTINGKLQQGAFSATIGAINSGLKKLARETPLAHDRKLYRGLSGLAFESAIFIGGECGDSDRPSSATPSLEVALQYAGERYSSLFEIVTGGIDRGAHLSWLSQFPAEDEHTILPLSAFEIVHQRTVSKKVLYLEAQLQKEKRVLLILLKLKDCTELRPVFSTLDLMENLFEEVDQNGDGTITLKEFTAHCKAEKNNSATPKHTVVKHAHAKNLFQVVKEAKESRIKGEEAYDIEHAKAELRALIPEALAELEQIQGHEHGKVSKKEFIDFCIRHGSVAASWKDSQHHSRATKVFSLIHQLSTSTSTVSRFSNSTTLQTPSADLDDDFGTNLTRELFTHLLEHCNVALSEVEVDDAFAYVVRSQGNVIHLFDLWQAVRETSLDNLRSQISANRIKQIEEEQKLYTNDNSDDDDNFINVLTLDLNVNLKAQTSEERLESRRTYVWDLYQNLRTEAANEKSIGADVVRALDLVWKTKCEGVPAHNFLEIAKFKAALEALLNAWHEVLKEEKLGAFNILHSMMQGIKSESLDKEGKRLIEELGKKSAALMIMCESSNEEDNKIFWPAVEDAFDKLTALKVRTHGARGLVDTMTFALDQGLKNNKCRNARRIAAHLVDTACVEGSCLPFVLSDDAFEKIEKMAGEDAAAKLRYAKGCDPNLSSITTYMHDHINNEDAQIQGLALLKRMQNKDHLYDTKTRARLEQAQMAKTVIASMGANSIHVARSGCSALLGMIESRPKDGQLQDALVSQIEGQLASLVQILERFVEDEKVVAEIIWIFTAMAADEHSRTVKILKNIKAAEIIQKAGKVHASNIEIQTTTRNMYQQLTAVTRTDSGFSRTDSG